jgi:hypothetical protein
MKAKQKVFAGIAVLLTAMTGILAGCDNASGGIITPPATVATPTTFPPAFLPEKEVVSGRKITLSTATAGATIYYTTNNTTPTTASDVYSDSSDIVITGATTIKAIAVKAGMTGSGVLTAKYTVGTPVDIADLTTLKTIYANEANLKKNYKLTADITTGVTAPIGLVDGGTIIPFTGDFDGGGYTITLNISASSLTGLSPGAPGSATYAGLFAAVGDRVHNLKVAGTVNVTSGVLFAGGVAGASLGEISDVESAVAVTANGNGMVLAGGVVGVSQGMINKASASGAVSATGTSGSVYAGGIAGISQGEISSASGSGTVSGSGTGSVYAGGIAGDAGGRVINVYTTGGVSATTSGNTSSAYAGGIAGTAGVMLSYAYATGAIAATGTGTGNTQHTIGAGGIAGAASSAVVKYTVALNSSVIASGDYYNRCAYRIASSRYGPTLNTGGAANYGDTALTPTAPGTGGTTNSGHEGDNREGGGNVKVTESGGNYTEPDNGWWNGTGFKDADWTTVWKWDSTKGLPVLR